MSGNQAFSIFTAISEVFVTAIVLYTIVGNLRGKPFQWRLLGGCLLFELCINVMYMVIRATQADTTQALDPGMKILFAVHGIMSLVMFVALLLLYLIAVFDFKSGHPTWFQRNVRATWGVLSLWLIAVISGEVIFVMHNRPKVMGTVS